MSNSFEEQHTQGLQRSSFLVRTYFLIRDYNILPKKELLWSPWVKKNSLHIDQQCEKAGWGGGTGPEWTLGHQQQHRIMFFATAWACWTTWTTKMPQNKGSISENRGYRRDRVYSSGHFGGPSIVKVEQTLP